MMRAVLMIAFVAACSTSTRDEGPTTCSDGVANGQEPDIDCGGSCKPCSDGAACAIANDCASGVCSGTCVPPSCADGVANGTEQGVDCGGVCPPIFEGIGCVNGTNGSKVCTSYTGGPKFTVTISWNAAGGNAYVDYIRAYGTNGEDYNAMGDVGGSAINVCTTGAMSQSFELPLGVGYTYKIWHAYCVRDDACDGCGNDTATAEGGTFGVVQSC